MVTTSKFLTTTKDSITHVNRCQLSNIGLEDQVHNHLNVYFILESFINHYCGVLVVDRIVRYCGMASVLIGSVATSSLTLYILWLVLYIKELQTIYV